MSPQKKIKILFSARDPAAGHAIKNLVNCSCNYKNIVVLVVSCIPASLILQDLKCDHIKLPLNMDVLSSELDQILSDYSPDVVIAGASGPDAGIDELLIKKSSQTLSYIIQDFWGDVNLSLGATADCYLVSDELAAEMTRQRVSSEVHVVGSVKHASYSAFHVNEMRANKRKKLNLSGEDLLLGYFGMPLDFLEGYWKSLIELSKSIKKIQYPSIKLTYRPHPKETLVNRERTVEILSNVVDEFYEDNDVTVENTLMACDLILSCYSSCGIDSELLGRNADADNRLSMFLLYNEDVYNYYKKYTGLNDLPLSMQNRSLTIKTEKELISAFEKFKSKDMRSSFLCEASPSLPSGESAFRVFEKVLNDCSS
jgi:hypothetical protein